jgi:hypothetical protein
MCGCLCSETLAVVTTAPTREYEFRNLETAFNNAECDACLFTTGFLCNCAQAYRSTKRAPLGASAWSSHNLFSTPE